MKYKAWDGKRMYAVLALEWMGIDSDMVVGAKIAPLKGEEFVQTETDAGDLVILENIGHKDIDGNDIFEGDIVNSISSDKSYGSEVVWAEHEGRWGMKSLTFKNVSFPLNLSIGCSNWKIIGNKFQNPELLKN